jgi:hypothetical protein
MLLSHGTTCSSRVFVKFLKSRVKAFGGQYQTIGVAVLRRLALQEKNAQGEVVYKLKREFWK